MSTKQSAASVTPPPGHVAIRLPLFGRPGEELAVALGSARPRWMRRMHELEEASNERIDSEANEVTASAALSTLADELRHRMQLLAFVCGVLEQNGWDIELTDDVLLATARTTPYDARRTLEDLGVAGPMCAVTDLDDSGWPRMWYGGDDRGRDE